MPRYQVETRPTTPLYSEFDFYYYSQSNLRLFNWILWGSITRLLTVRQLIPLLPDYRNAHTLLTQNIYKHLYGCVGRFAVIFIK